MAQEILKKQSRRLFICNHIDIHRLRRLFKVQYKERIEWSVA